MQTLQTFSISMGGKHWRGHMSRMYHCALSIGAAKVGTSLKYAHAADG
jgi:hypothetical protein